MKCKTCGHDVSDITCCEVCYPPDRTVYVNAPDTVRDVVTLPLETYTNIKKREVEMKKHLDCALGTIWRIRIYIKGAIVALPELRREMGTIDPALVGHPFNRLNEHIKILKSMVDSTLVKDLLKLI